jgi:hypothetical protein
MSFTPHPTTIAIKKLKLKLKNPCRYTLLTKQFGGVIALISTCSKEAEL